MALGEKKISSLTMDNGEEVDDASSTREASKVFFATRRGTGAMEGVTVLPCFEKKLDEAEAQHLSRTVTTDEICSVVRDFTVE